MRISTLVLATATALVGGGLHDVASAQTLGSAITYQGMFANAGVPASGSYDFEFALYAAASGGSAVQTVTKTGVIVNGGLINTLIDFGAATYDGQVKWVEVHVRPAGGGSYTTLNPRQALTAAPYAMGLPMPFQRLVHTGSAPSFQITNADGGTAISGVVPTNSGFAAVLGTSAGGPGVNGASTSSAGVRGTSEQGDGVRGLGFIGVHGVGSLGVWAEGGLEATDNISCNVAGNCQSVVNIRNGSIGNLIIASAGTPSQDVFRVNGNGSVFANGDYNAGGADIAEYVPASEKLEPGDVVEIDEVDGHAFRLSSQANSTSVGGVISTKPGVSLNTSVAEESAAKGMPRLALTGRVPVKVTSENGAIRAGDLLVSSSKRGRAMRAPQIPQPGTVIGKAMQRMDHDGEIEMLVMLR
ncbi:MAG: hypothetical protein ABI082_04925 [Dokdonella sp.]